MVLIVPYPGKFRRPTSSGGSGRANVAQGMTQDAQPNPPRDRRGGILPKDPGVSARRSRVFEPENGMISIMISIMTADIHHDRSLGGRPPRPNVKLLRGSVPKQLKERVHADADARHISVSALMTEILCDFYGVEVDEQNLIVGDPTDDDHDGAVHAA